ncbi:DUF4412 domain-containing protein [Winogradskyella sediminis]|uniref:DUF4412 domain-containing protein n=1 Tax=Winogradskyella sediminis TaxID=1382466 RepID=A0A1H1USB6_9FLAO|nr:DUF4412 domain-containing protein [Winogradskyella sediminis]REG85305.1 hypothetical protein C8N41_104165 [Winogradskyella sediminis]SDS75363.1 hypothetical protein SAMN04489797_2338 [Winogradskyella sediminis]
MKKILVLGLALMLNMVATAQDQMQEGVLTAKQTMASDNEQMNAQLKAMGDSEATTYFKGTKSRSETSNPMTGDMTIIVDGEEKQMLMLIDQLGVGKKYILQSFVPSEEDLKSVTVEKGSETKTVMGYECQQYIVKMKQNGQDVEMQMFTTDKISAFSHNTTAMGDQVEGYPLYFVMKMNQMGASIEVTSEVTEIKQESVSDDKLSLTPPEGYTKMEGM